MLSIGDNDVVYCGGQPVSNPIQGMKGICNGTPCTYHIGWGWMTDDELFSLRQSDPRVAP